jgi:hypothetical protein
VYRVYPKELDSINWPEQMIYLLKIRLFGLKNRLRKTDSTISFILLERAIEANKIGLEANRKL